MTRIAVLPPGERIVRAHGQAPDVVVIRVRVAWWLRWYLAGVYMMALTTGMRPDQQKVADMVMKALTFKAERAR
ncbi:hypothetical protein [Xenophilus sp. Marseille-Q4582]|uniref:hypothetical protein n=1 Tax=Xenophilus sp. Marseille-Q4582 TaxID=2866600 RepID=UPI001CE3CE42|nr:hypothetical protein [Xenophilus sp. Marseille-Q4582]